MNIAAGGPLRLPHGRISEEKETVKNLRTAAVALVVLGSVALAGCSSSSAAGDHKDSASKGGSSYVAEATAAVEAAYQGLYTAPPASGPTAQKGKEIWVVSCFQALPGCAEPTAGVQEAGKVLGWHVTVVDGKADPSGYTAAIRQAVAAHADGIIGIAIDCAYAKAALQEAKGAGIPTVGVYTYDCNDPKVDAGGSLYTALINSNGTPGEFGARWGRLRADYAIKATDGNAHIIQLTHPDFVVTQYQDEAFRNEIAKCSGCDIVGGAAITAADLGDPATAAQKVSTVLQQYPNANVLQVPSDTLLLEAAQAIKAANRKGLVVIGGEGYAATLELVRSGVASVAVAIPTNWLGWSGADAMNRVLAGETKIPNEGADFQIIDKDHGLPSAGKGWTPSLDYKAAFTQAWNG
jgi:ribose transport system substrate-binding protein